MGSRCAFNQRVIPGTRSVDHLEDNLRAADVTQDLSDVEVAELTALADEADAALQQMPTRVLAALRRPRT